MRRTKTPNAKILSKMTSEIKTDGSISNMKTSEKNNFFPELRNETAPPRIPKHHIVIALLDELVVFLIIVALLYYYFSYLS